MLSSVLLNMLAQDFLFMFLYYRVRPLVTGLSKLVTQIWPPTWRVDKTTKWFRMRIWRQQSDVWKHQRWWSLEIARLHLKHSGIVWGRSWWNQRVSDSHGKYLRTCHQFLRATESCHGTVRFHKLAHDGWGGTLKGLWNPWATEFTFIASSK